MSLSKIHDSALLRQLQIIKLSLDFVADAWVYDFCWILLISQFTIHLRPRMKISVDNDVKLTVSE